MIIDKEKLIQLLVDKTGFEEAEVEAQLLELIKRVNQAAEEGKTFEIEGFGTFGMEDGVLQFTPSDTLETEINNKYAGMKPIELIGAFKEPAAEMPDVVDEAEDPEEGSWTFDEKAADEEEDRPVEEPAPVTAESDEEKIIALSDLLNDEVEKVLETTKEEKEKQSSEKEPDKVSKESVEKTEQEKQKEVSPVGKQEKEKDKIGRFLVAAVIVIALGVTGFLVYDMGFDEGNSGFSSSFMSADNQPVEQAQTSSPGTTEEENAITSAGDPEPEQEEEVATTEETSEQSPYGLRGQVNRDINNGYTIVVHSLRSMDKAEENRQDLEAQGFRALISKASVGGTMYYRVGIGQFPTVEAAQDAIDEIPEQYTNRNFIKRIQ